MTTDTTTPGYSYTQTAPLCLLLYATAVVLLVVGLAVPDEPPIRWLSGYGHIEIGDQEGFGFVVRAIDYGGVVFEDDHPTTLAEAMAALEKGLAEWFEEQGE